MRHAGLDLHERTADTRSALAHQAVPVVLRHGGVPGAKEVRAEREHEPRVRQIEGRQLIATKAERVGASQHLIAEQFIGDRSRRAVAAEKLLDEGSAVTGAMARHKCECLLVARPFKRVETRDDLRECHVPGDRVVAA